MKKVIRITVEIECDDRFDNDAEIAALITTAEEKSTYGAPDLGLLMRDGMRPWLKAHKFNPDAGWNRSAYGVRCAGNDYEREQRAGDALQNANSMHTAYHESRVAYYHAPRTALALLLMRAGKPKVEVVDAPPPW